MKRLLVVFFIFIAVIAFADNGKPRFFIPCTTPDTSVVTQILALPLQSYIGKPVDSLFSVLPCSYDSRGFIPAHRGRCKGLFQSYFTSEFNNCYVEIYIDTFQYMAFPNYTRPSTWSMTLAKKETVAFIKVYKNNTICIYGCNNPNYYD